jgi:hypothetical protein
MSGVERGNYPVKSRAGFPFGMLAVLLGELGR